MNNFTPQSRSVALCSILNNTTYQMLIFSLVFAVLITNLFAQALLLVSLVHFVPLSISPILMSIKAKLYFSSA
jgi:hypothetical protein